MELLESVGPRPEGGTEGALCRGPARAGKNPAIGLVLARERDRDLRGHVAAPLEANLWAKQNE